jgi:hypothetical protein
MAQYCVFKRTMIFRVSLMLLLPLILVGCATHPASNRIYEQRAASSASSQRMLVLTDPLDWHSTQDGGRYDIWLPQGIYHVEGQDDDYLYYLAPERVSLGKQKMSSEQDGKLYDGGIFISKNAGAKYSSGAYVDYDNGKKLLLFFFDSRFTKQEGKSWHYLSE